ncbi:Zn-dependent hydrolase [Marinobacterium mangrovicola]|uniref:N-carbamoyl-L-amino-acid hydrolase n=1 Tax=Marinobacterium mangrovicola TaxID=1476959 RepID=A0A4R1G8N9_9GAMM|nr:Zn-dependent hydrolase [Marinobacterium mangrovicola]TCK02963.1 N-carbamoyl-L-amino-acid hydrolase [Marinobacterium mangrovicola]
MTQTANINIQRLIERIKALGQCGALAGGGAARIALTEQDKQGRDQVVSWMKELGLKISVDQLGNVLAVREGQQPGKPVLVGSHIDTVATGGLYDGNLGVLAGLEVVQTLNEAGISTRRPIAIGFFTNEEGVRFTPDMMGSMVHQGHIELESVLNTRGTDGTILREELERIGYNGSEPCGSMRAHAFIELHVEQGPVLEQEGFTIGAVEGVQGISWTEITVSGVSNHAGTTPMAMRHDAGYAAMAIATFARALAKEMGGYQVATVGCIEMKPNLVNVIPNSVKMTVDLRNTENDKLQEAESRLQQFIEEIAEQEGVTIQTRQLVRFDPTPFDERLISLVEMEADRQGYRVKRLPSGAGHDAQAFAPNCPTAMIFVPSVKGLSHNIEEYTSPDDIEAGANVLLNVVRKLAGE